MKFIFHGGAREVGRSCIEFQTNSNKKYLFDAGIKFKEDGYEYPKVVDELINLDAVFLSHAHLDHSGALPLMFHKKVLPLVYTTGQTFAIIKVLLKDSFEVARIKHLDPAYEKIDIKKCLSKVRVVQFDREYTLNDLKFKFLNAGHIPGSASILIECDEKNILYTGDINSRESNLMVNLNPKEHHGKIDVLITESTYGYRDLPSTEEVAKELLDEIVKVLKNNGSVVIPVFALGRSQELLIILSKLYFEKGFNYPLYFDGMANKITRKILTENPDYIKNIRTLSKMFFQKANFVLTQNQRNKISLSKQPKIILTTSGMVQGGPVMSYIKDMWGDSRNAIFLVGYQCKGTNGRMLLDTGEIYLKGWKTKVQCQVKKFAFSGHLDMTEIKEYIEDVSPKYLIVQHGDEESVDNICNWAKEKLPKTKVYGPSVGDEIEIN